MNRSLEDFFLGNHEDMPLEGRIFNAICGCGCLLSFFGTITNAMFKETLEVFLNLIGTLLTGALYWYSRKTGNYKPFSLPIGFVILALCIFSWVNTSGTLDGIGYYFIALAICSLIILEGRNRTYFFLLILAILAVLLAIEYFIPPDKCRVDRFRDVATSLVLCLLFIAAIVYIVIEQHMQDKEKIKRAMEEIKTLRGFLPICSKCKKIRDIKGDWKMLEQYIEKHTEAEFSHGLCPECLKKVYDEYLPDNHPLKNETPDKHTP